MSNDQMLGFFREVYSDPTLQGKLNYALVAALPDVVAQIAQAVGYDVTTEDISMTVGDRETAEDLKTRHEAIAEYVLPRDFWYDFRRSSVWKVLDQEQLGMFHPFREAHPFRMTIPGPTWVQVMGGERETTSAARDYPSAVELYDSL